MQGTFRNCIRLGLTIVALAAFSSAAPAFAQFNPIQTAKDAWKKAKQQTQQQRQGQQQQQPAAQPVGAPSSASIPPSQPTSSANQPAAAGAPIAAEPQAGGGAWQPPADNPSATPAALAGPLDPAKLPDVLGIHMGEAREAASSTLLKLYPGSSVQPEGPDTVAGMYIGADLPGKSGADNVHLEFTLTPGKQRVYYIKRDVFYKQHMSRDNVVAALRQKYGHELFLHPNYGTFYWLYDEQGHLVSPDKDPTRVPYGCDADEASGKMFFHGLVSSYLHGGLPPATFCDSLIVLSITLPLDPLIDRIFTVFEDRAMLRREASAMGEVQKAQIQKQQQQDLKNAQEAKPTF